MTRPPVPEPARTCQTCGSDDPAWYLEDSPSQIVCRWNKLLGCPDDFHTEPDPTPLPEPERCPTCESDDPATCRFQSDPPGDHQHARQRGELGCCPDPFHQPISESVEAERSPHAPTPDTLAYVETMLRGDTDRAQIADYLRDHVRPAAESVEAALSQAEAERDEARKIRYLGIPCSNCGRLRVEYDPNSFRAKCEKCGADTHDNELLCDDIQARVETIQASHDALVGQLREAIEAWEQEAKDDDGDPFFSQASETRRDCAAHLRNLLSGSDS